MIILHYICSWNKYLSAYFEKGEGRGPEHTRTGSLPTGISAAGRERITK